MMIHQGTRTYVVSLVVLLFFVMIVVSGGTYAYWTWTSETDKNVVFTTADIRDKVVYNEGSSYFIGDFQPTSTFCENVNTTHSFYKTSDAEDLSITATIYMDINSIETNIANSDDVYWVITSGDSGISCVNGLDSASVFDYGTFNGYSSGDVIELASDIDVTLNEQFYTIWIWMDSYGDNLSLLSGETVDTNIWTQFDLMDSDSSNAYAIYSEDDASFRFYKNDDVVTVGSVYNGRTVTNLYTGIETTSYIYDYENYESYQPWLSIAENVEIVVVEDKISPISTAGWFAYFENTSSIDVTRLDTSNVTDMSGMFESAGFYVYSFEIVGMDNWDTSNVKNMAGMFDYAGNIATKFNIGDLSNWDTSNVKNMAGMFFGAGINAEIFNIGNIGNWNVGKVTSMSYMFHNENYPNDSVNTWYIGDLSNWNVSSVTNMEYMFCGAGQDAESFDIGNLSNWDTSNVTSMEQMFDYAGYNADYTLDLSGWNVSKVTKHSSFNYGVESKVIAPIWVN